MSGDAYGEGGETRHRRAGLALGFGGVMYKKGAWGAALVTKKNRPLLVRRVYVESCFACGCIVPRLDRNVVAVFWGDGDPGRDEVVVPWRQLHVRLCFRDRMKLQEKGGLTFRHGEVEVQLVLETSNEKSKTRGDGVIPVRGTRRAYE